MDAHKTKWSKDRDEVVERVDREVVADRGVGVHSKGILSIIILDAHKSKYIVNITISNQ